MYEWCKKSNEIVLFSSAQLLESELSRFQVPSKKIAERKSEKLEHEKSVSLKVSKVLNQEKGKLHQLKRKKDEERQVISIIYMIFYFLLLVIFYFFIRFHYLYENILQ